MLWNKCVLNKGIYIKDKKKGNGSYSIPCIFKQYINEDNIKVYFSINIDEDFGLDKEIISSVENVIIVPDFVFNYFVINYGHNIVEIGENKDNDIINDEDKFDYMVYSEVINKENVHESKKKFRKNN